MGLLKDKSNFLFHVACFYFSTMSFQCGRRAGLSNDRIRVVHANRKEMKAASSWCTPNLVVNTAYEALPSNGWTAYMLLRGYMELLGRKLGLSVC